MIYKFDLPWYNSPSIDLGFREFLIEMETTTTEKDDIRTIIQKLRDGDGEWLNQHEILWGDKGPYWIVNYRQGARNQYNRLVRGMVIQKPNQGFHGDNLSLIRSFPFTRFYNQGEKDAAPVDFSNAEMLEKMDGTMVGVFFPHADHTRPEFHTRKMLSTHEPDMSRVMTTFTGKEARFLPEIKNFVQHLAFSDSDTQFTYVFEFIHEISYVLTKYKPEQHGLYLLGGRNIQTHRELTEDELDKVAKRIGCRRGRRWDAAKHHAEIEQMFKDVAADTPDFEGFVFRDKKTGHRVKVKDQEYVRKHHMLDGLNYKKLIPRVLEGEEDEVIAYFPHAKELVDEIKKAYSKYLDKIVAIVQKWQATGLTGRALSVELHGENPLPKWELRLRKMRGEPAPTPQPKEDDTFARNMILQYHQVKDPDDLRNAIDKELKEIALGQGKNAGNPKALVDMIGLYDKEDDETAPVNTGEI